MATKTTNYDLVKPAENETADIGVINANMDTIDAQMKTIDNSKEALIKDSTEKTTMVDADALPLIDSADGSKTKKLTFANLKILLKTIFATTEDVSALSSSLSTEITNRTNAVSGEATARANADSTLQANITNEATARSNADALKANIASANLTGTPTIASNIIYHAGNITISTVAPTAALTEGYQHQVYA